MPLTLTTNPDIISNLEIHPEMSDHSAVSYAVDFIRQKTGEKTDRYVYQYKKGNIRGVKRDMGNSMICSSLKTQTAALLMITGTFSKQPSDNPSTGTFPRRRLLLDGTFLG